MKFTIPGELAKAGGPFIGPRGGKWKDAAHTIPWESRKPGAYRGAEAEEAEGEHRVRVLEENERGYARMWKLNEAGRAHMRKLVDRGVSPQVAASRAARDPKHTVSLVEQLEERERKAEQGNWYPASGGTEKPFVTRTGRRLLYVHQPTTGKHAYLDVDTDLILTDEEAQHALGKSEQFVIPIARAMPEEFFEKSRGPLSHKYLRRERAFVSGKLTWRYWYADDIARQQGRAQHDPEDKHEHRLVSEEKDVHPNLKGKIISAIEATVSKIASFFGFGKKPSTVKVTARAGWTKEHHDPFVKAEQEGKEVVKSPQGRIQRALELLPEHLKELITDTEDKYTALDELILTKLTEDEYASSRLMGGMVVGGYTSPSHGYVVVTDAAVTKPDDAPKFGSRSTLTESIVVHELGHRVHFAFEKTAPATIASWKAVNEGGGKRISPYANTSWAEDFAETFSCAITHPQQLADQCPERYTWMRENVLPDLPELSKIRTMPPEDFAWWEDKPQTPATKVLNQLKVQEPATRFAPYYSEHDQFFLVSKGGRTVYFRYGPEDKLSEPGWSRMPPTIDEKTGLPRYEGGRFEFRHNLKEIYDQNGNPLTDRQAYFYLGQDDEDVIKDAQVAGGDNPEAKYLDWARTKKNDTHALGYKAYSALGQSKTEKTLAEERKRVEEERKKGGTGYRPRHDWVPVEISKREFVAKSGTFKFGDIREAKEQPNVLRDVVGGKSVVRMGYDAVAGKEVPLLSSRVYEQQNPDGTYTRIRVSEAAPFAVGQTIQAPQVVEREVEGQPRKMKLWLPYKLKEGDSLDPDELARQFGISGRTLLEANHTYGSFRIMDPIAGALLDPEGNVEVRSAADLDAAMRVAAGSDPPRRAWVSVSSGGDVRTATVAHLQVEWDGAGSPKVLGSYWSSKAGKPEIRVDDLIDKDDKIRLPRIVEKAAPPRTAKSGDFVWITDPATKKRVVATLVRVTMQEGKKVYQVQPIARQGAGVAKRLITVDAVAAMKGDEIPGRPDVRRRYVEPLEHDLLLYMDEVPVGSSPIDPGGVVKIKLPKDGSIGHEQIQRVAGVRVVPPDPDQLLEGSYQVALRDIPAFRESIGGFVMDPRVTATLNQEIRDARMRLEKTRTLDQLVKPSDIEGEDGNINPDGLLRGLTTGDAGIQPGSWRIRALQKIANNGGRLFAAHYMGCLSGDAEISVHRRGKGFKIKISDLYARFHGHEGRWEREHPTYAQSVFGEHVRLNDIDTVVESGVKETYLLRTSDGREIRATAEHPFWTPSGWVRLDDLRPGDRVGIRGAVEPSGRAPKKYKYPFRTALRYHPFAGVRGAKLSPYRVPTHRLVVEADMNGIPLETLCERCRTGNVAGLQFLDPKQVAVHHIDGDTLNNDRANLEVLSHTEHWRKHGEQDGWTNFTQFRVGWVEVAFIGDEKTEQTYDICMNPQSQSYVANDFVVHNTGKTNLAIMADQMMRNLNDAEGNAHPGRTTGKTVYCVPANKPADWFEEIKRFAGETPTLLGASTLANAVQVPKLVPRGTNEKEEVWKKRAIEDWKARVKTEPNLWNPWADSHQRVVVGHEYFRDHEDAMRITGLFDGLIVDEAHKIVNDNELSRVVQRWSPNMRLFLPMSGTPVRNRLNVLPRIVDLVSGGQQRFASEEEFVERYLIPSPAAKAMGVRNPPKTDLNPATSAELMAIIAPYIDVATVADVKSKMMPGVLVDENSPAHMIGQQARMYRAQVAKLTEEDRIGLEQTNLGIDEAHVLDENARRKIAAARNVANCPAYKMPDERETLTYDARLVTFDRLGRPKGVTTAPREFRLPTYETMVGKGPQGWRGKWPTYADVESERVEPSYLEVLRTIFEHMMGVTYESVEGKPIDKEILAAISKGDYVTPRGQEWAGRVLNPDYGPEAMMSRGVLDEDTGKIAPVPFVFYDEHGQPVKGMVPPGTRFVRDPRMGRKGSALYYHEKDWDFTGRFDATDDSEGGKGEDAESVLPSEKKDKGKGKGKAREQQPLEGHEDHDINRSPERRIERAMFDAVVTTGNAKADALEEWMKNALSGKTGDAHPERAQFVLFGNRLGSSVRTIESKLRTMGYQDVNEALGHPAWSSESDKARRPRQYFVTFLSKGGTLGDRDLNSEIFRRKQDQFGNPIGDSMFVHRSLNGSTGKPPKVGEVKEGWTRKERADIAASFVDGRGAIDKTGKPSGLEMPMRVTAVESGGKVSMRYCYESDLDPKDRARVKELENLVRGSLDKKKTAEYLREQKAIFDKHWTDRLPLTDHQQYVFNHCQAIVASDAAAVGMNWTSGYLAMYDSLFSPMDEAQRIARAARQLPPAFAKEIRPIVEKIQTHITAQTQTPDATNVRFDPESAQKVVNDAIDALDPSDKAKLAEAPGGAPDQLVEAIFATRALDRLQSLLKPVGDELRSTGLAPDPSRPAGDGNWIPREAVTDQDVRSYLIRTRLSPFERACLKARPYLVDVKRFTTSVDVPLIKYIGKGENRIGVAATDEEGNTIFQVESPNEAERAQLAQARAKNVGYEQWIKQVQNAQPIHTPYDFVPAQSRSFGVFSTLDPARLAQDTENEAAETLPYLTEEKERRMQKAQPPRLFVIRSAYG